MGLSASTKVVRDFMTTTTFFMGFISPIKGFNLFLEKFFGYIKWC